MGYHRLFVLSLLFLSVLAATLLAGHAMPLASPWGDLLVKHQWNDIPDNWVVLGHPPDGTTIDLHIELKPHRENALIDAFFEVSQPGHPRYGAHLSKGQVAGLVAPHPDTLEFVGSWLKHNGVPPSSISTTLGGDWLTVAGVPLSQANKLLGASFQLYNHTQTNNTILRTIRYALPEALHMHVKTVAPTTAFTPTRLQHQAPHRRSSGAAALAANATLGEPVDELSRRDSSLSFVHPGSLRWLYKVWGYNPVPGVGNMLGIAGFEYEAPGRPDLEVFMKDHRTDVKTAIENVDVVPVNGGEVDQDDPDRQANFDTQYSVALTHPIPVTYYTVGGSEQISTSKEPDKGDTYLEWFNHMDNPTTPLPQTINVVWNIDEKYLPFEYADSLCRQFLKLGSRGVSILVASGDEGVGACMGAAENALFQPVFPASCPWVTSVGGTKGETPEIASARSGGGFSTFFPRPPYQKDAVPPYVENLRDQYEGRYTPQNRGIPDIAVQSVKYTYVFGGRELFTSGTSCSATTAAAIISLLNDYQLFKGRKPLGFLNNLLYETNVPDTGLNDITSGNNPGCGTQGFSASSGWDPVTGLGSLDFQRLQSRLDLIASLAAPDPGGSGNPDEL